MKIYEPKVARCTIRKTASKEVKEWQINGARLQAQKDLQNMMHKEINNSLSSKDDCYVFCYFGETELYKSHYDNDFLAKNFIYDFAIVKEKTWKTSKFVANSYYYLIKENCLSQGTAIVKQNMGLYKVPYKFLKFLQETSPFDFKNM